MAVTPRKDDPVLRLRRTALEHYATNAAARAAIAAIPIVGGAVDALAGTAGGNLLTDRLRIFFEELRAALDAVQERLDQAVTQEHVQDAAIKAVRGAVETGDREKVRLLVAILAEAVTRDRPEKLDPEAVLAELVNLSSATLRVARHMYDEATAEWHPVNSGIPAPAEFADVEFHVQRLEAAGLIRVVQAQALMGSSVMPTRYEPTPTFRRIMAMVRHEIDPPIAEG